MGNKYHSKKIQTPDGIFDSKKEYARWLDLKLLERGRFITDLRRQVPYELIPSQYVTDCGKRRCVERPVKYVADFVYQKNGQTVVEDTKGVRTTDYIIKRKLMLWVHGIKIQEI